jgi:serine/threonine-protein kinase RsbT
MSVLRTELLPLKNSNDVVLARQKVRQWAVDLRFTLVDQTKLVTAASELARNALDHGKGGQMKIESLVDGVKSGLRLVFEDQGPGIPDIELALKDGYTTGAGMGLGLGGSKRLVNQSASNRKSAKERRSRSRDGNSPHRMDFGERRQFGGRIAAYGHFSG